MDKQLVQSLQYGKPKKNDPRKTPAKPSERRKGSKKNKKDSASKPNNSIQMSKSTESRIRKLMVEHNAKVAKKGKGSKATMGRLKSVFRRGAGAFSRTHAPNMSRSGWGVARVKAFLYLLRNGRPSNPNYKQDNDLLPKSHPRATVDEDYEDWTGEIFEAAEYQGRKVNLNKPFRMPKGNSKKFGVYTKNDKGNVVIVRFGDPNMEIRRDDDKARKNYRSRMGCDTARVGPKWKANYWSCKMWERGKSVKDYTSSDFNKTDEALTSNMSDCGCGGCGSVEAAEPKPNNNESHDEYMSRCTEMGYSQAECMEAHEGHTFQSEEDSYEEFLSAGMEDYIFSDEEGARKKSQEIGLGDTFHTDTTADGTKLYFPGKDEATFQQWFDKNDSHDASYHSCGMGEEMVGGKCQKVAVTIDIDFSVDETILEASTGRQIVRISGIAFHEGINKNGWQITRAGANLAVSQMVGADLTLNHPPSESGRFKRNMDGGVEDAVVGIVTQASIVDQMNANWEVKFKADVYRTELFEALETGLWLRKGYGVSIGGSGIPDEMIEAEDGRTIMKFETDFQFDHLAIVHKPAYDRASIDTVERATVSMANAEVFNSHKEHGVNYNKVNSMTEEEIIVATEEAVVETPDLSAELEALKASLAEKDAQLNAIKAAEDAKAESHRVSLVEKATEMGIAGVSELPSETIETIMASFEAKTVVSEEVDMKPIVASESIESPVKASESTVANYLNGRKLQTPEEIYEKGFNVWANAWNQTVSDKSIRSPLYAEAKEQNLI